MSSFQALSGTPNIVTSLVTQMESTVSVTLSSGSSTSTNDTALAKAGIPASPSRLTPAGKIEAGVCVPLGIIILATILFLIYRGKKKKQRARSTKTELSHDITEGGSRIDSKKITRETVGGENDAMNVHELQQTDVHQLHGTDIVPYSRELAGSTGVERSELSARCNTRRGSK